MCPDCREVDACLRPLGACWGSLFILTAPLLLVLFHHKLAMLETKPAHLSTLFSSLFKHSLMFPYASSAAPPQSCRVSSQNTGCFPNSQVPCPAQIDIFRRKPWNREMRSRQTRWLDRSSKTGPLTATRLQEGPYPERCSSPVLVPKGPRLSLQPCWCE